MNLIAHLSGDSAIMDSVSLKHSLYYYLLSNATNDRKRGEVLCAYSLKEVPEQLRFFEPAQVKEALKELAADELIVLRKKTYEIVLGVSQGTIYKLFGSKMDSSLEDYRKLLLDAADRFVDSSTGLGMPLARNNKRNVENLLDLPYSDWTVKDFVKLFDYSYVSLYQQSSRAFGGKEIGQMKSLFASFTSSSVLFKMIVHYVFHSEKYNKRQVNIGIFMYNKDEIYALVTNKSAEKNKMTKMSKRTESDEEESFV